MSAPRDIAVVTSTRAEYGILRPVLKALDRAEDFTPRLMVCGAHLSEKFGHTIDRIRADGMAIAAEIDTLAEGDDAIAAAETNGRTVAGFAAGFAKNTPDMVLLTGDRPEMLAVATAAQLSGVPIAHLHGGELTFGAIDDAIRHALTKMSHIHFAATRDYADRILQMGEDPARVFVTGAPGLDNIAEIDVPDEAALSAALGLPLSPKPLLCTFHPLTIGTENTLGHISAMLGAIDASGLPAIFTYPGADPQSGMIIEAIEAFVSMADDRAIAANLGTEAYFGLMKHAAAMVGNSSSGIIEAASFALPVVNIGDRQAGRTRVANVIDAPGEENAVRAAIEKAVSEAFRDGLSGLANPYGDGKAAKRIVAALRDAPPREALLMKKFRDLPRAG